MNKRNRGFLMIALGLVMILAGVGLHVLHEQQDALAGQNAGILLNELTYEIKYNYPAAVSPAPGKEAAEETDSPAEESMPTRTLSGYDLVGILQIPSLGLELPVLSEWSYPLLNVAPCRYAGSVYNNDMVIAGHNYKTHFGSLKNLSPGDAVLFTDAAGRVFTYRVVELETLQPSAVEEMKTGDWDLTLFTCTYGGRSRVTVRCERAE